MTEITSGYAKTLFNLARRCPDPDLAREAVQHGAAIEIAHRASAVSSACASLFAAAMERADPVLDRLMSLQ